MAEEVSGATSPPPPAAPPVTLVAPRARGLRLFLLISIGLHVGLVLGWGIPEYVHFAELRRQKRERQQLLEVRRELDVKARDEERRQLQKATVREVAHALRRDFDRIVQDDLAREDANDLWLDVAVALREPLDRYALELSDSRFSEDRLADDLNGLKRSMVRELYEHLCVVAVAQLASNFAANVETRVVPQLAEYYRLEIARLVANPLRQEGARAIRNEAAFVERERAEIRLLLEDALRQADRLQKDGTSLLTRLASIEKDLPRPPQENSAAQAAAIKEFARGLTLADVALNTLQDDLRHAKEKDAVFGVDFQQKLAEADRQSAGARQKLAADLGLAPRDTLAKAQQRLGAHLGTATSLHEAVAAARTAAAGAAFDPVALARAVLKNIRNPELEALMEDAFLRGFREKSVPRLTGKLGQAFKQALDSVGINDEAAVQRMRKQIQDALATGVPRLTHAGTASTAALNADENLAESQENPNTNAVRAQAFAEQFRRTTHALADKEMVALAEGTHADDAAVALASEQGEGVSRILFRRRKTALAQAGSAAPPPEKTGSEDGLMNALERAGNLVVNVNAGRMGFLDAGGGLSSAQGLAAGPASGLPCNGNTVSRLGAAGLGGMGLPFGLANLGKDTDPGASSLARLRQNALARGQGLGLGGTHSVSFNPEEHARLTEGVQARDLRLSQGEHSAPGHAGPALLNDGVTTGFPYAKVILPNAPQNPLTGAPLAKEPYKPPFKTINFAAIPFLRSKPALAADPGAWMDLPSLPLHRADFIERPGLRVVDPQFVKAAWDNTGLYFFYDVKDADGKIRKVHPDVFWEGDAVEIWFDTRNTKDKKRGNSWAQQFWVWPFGQAGDDKKIGGEAALGSNSPFLWSAFGQEEIQRVAKLTPEGWTMAVHVPAARVRELDLQPGRILGLNLSICTGTDIYYYWAGTDEVHTSMRPDTWGDIMLAGSDGELQIVDKLTGELKPGETARAPRTLYIGRPLKLRVTDADMNLSDSRRDTLSVTVRARSGASLVAVLQETAAASGVFEGGIATALNLGDPVPGALPLFEGETVDAIYLDQARANGSRNVEIKASLKSVAGIVDLRE